MAKQHSETPADSHPADGQPDDKKGFALSGPEKDVVEEKRSPRAAVLHEVIRREGEQELSRGVAALGWSSLAAGLSMGFSLLARGLLHRYLDGVPGQFLLESFGYSFGFIVVILARQQLFTENTMTAVLPLMTEPSLRHFGRLLRMCGAIRILSGSASLTYRDKAGLNYLAEARQLRIVNLIGGIAIQQVLRLSMAGTR